MTDTPDIEEFVEPKFIDICVGDDYADMLAQAATLFIADLEAALSKTGIFVGDLKALP